MDMEKLLQLELDKDEKSLLDKNQYIEMFKTAYKDNDKKSAENALIQLVIIISSEAFFGESYNHELRYLLLKSGCITNPMGMRYEQSNYEFIREVLLSIICKLKYINEQYKKNEDTLFETDHLILEPVIQDCIDLSIYTECFYNMNLLNSKRIDENAIGKLPLVELFYSILLFNQDQIRIVKNSYNKIFNYDNRTGMEMLVSDQSPQYYEDYKVSLSDSLEAGLEGIDELVRYIYYKNRNSFNERIELNRINFSLIRPYENTEFEKLLHIANQRHLLQDIEEGVRYGYFGPCLIKTSESQEIFYYFKIENIEKYCTHILGIIRRELEARKLSMIDYRNQKDLSKANICIEVLADELISLQTKDFCIFDFSNFHPDIEKFKSAAGISITKVRLVELLTKNYYLNLDVKGVDVQELIDGFMYLCTLSEILFKAADKTIVDDAPETFIKELTIVEIKYLENELARIYSLNDQKVKSVIKRFIFHEKDNAKDDIFSQPLLKISKTQVLLSEALFDQINLDRVIERQIIRYNKNVSKVGRIFEREFVEKLCGGYSSSLIEYSRKKIQGLNVNTNKIEYDAYDGKQIEFDVFATLDNYLILVELKSVMTSYNLDDLNNRMGNIYTAIEQLDRRAESVQYDWEIIRKLASIELPDSPYDREHIIKVACTDAYDFTPLKIGDVFVTDDSTFLKYFTNPYVDTVLQDSDGTLNRCHKKIWKNEKPDVGEFLEYLIHPVTTEYISEVMDKKIVPVIRFDESDYNIVCEEYSLIEDPIKKAAEKLLKEENLKRYKKIYPNDLCPCGSGKKYKKCHGM